MTIYIFLIALIAYAILSVVAIIGLHRRKPSKFEIIIAVIGCIVTTAMLLIYGLYAHSRTNESSGGFITYVAPPAQETGADE